ncbi:hypothetical protein AK34_5745 [Burkholderia dolosa AU0158]|nr:hypothetical protein AK34_5745 [Burkholderia dolosa AU0158]
MPVTYCAAVRSNSRSCRKPASMRRTAGLPRFDASATSAAFDVSTVRAISLTSTAATLRDVSCACSTTSLRAAHSVTALIASAASDISVPSAPTTRWLRPAQSAIFSIEVNADMLAVEGLAGGDRRPAMKSGLTAGFRGNRGRHASRGVQQRRKRMRGRAAGRARRRTRAARGCGDVRERSAGAPGAAAVRARRRPQRKCSENAAARRAKSGALQSSPPWHRYLIDR